MSKRRIALWGLMSLCALGAGLWGRGRILHPPPVLDPTRYVSYRARGAFGEGVSDTVSARTFVPASMLGRQVSKASVEAYLAEVASHDGAPKWHQVQVAFVLSAWRDGDEFRRFNSPPDTWESLCGRKGIALLRDGVAITGYLTELN